MTTVDETMNFADDYSDFFGAEEEGAAPADEFETGKSDGPPALQFFKGYKLNIVNAQGKVTTDLAHGFMFDADRIPDDLKEILDILVKDGQVQYIRVRHSSKEGSNEPNVVGHYKIVNPEFYILTHATPFPDAIFDEEAKQKGLAMGYQTFLDDKAGTYDRTKFLSVLAVEKHLYEAGYVDSSTGAPKLIRISLTGYNADEMYKALTAHSNFIKAQRTWVANQRQQQIIKELKAANKPVNKQAVEAQAKRFAIQHVQFFTYAVRCGATEGMETHGQGTDSADVYEIESKAIDLYGMPSRAEKELHCDKLLFRQLAAFLWNNSVQPPVVGGEAIDWCREYVAKWHDNEESVNPHRPTSYRRGDKDRALKLGKDIPMPQYLKLRQHLNDAAQFNPDAVNGNGHNGSRSGVAAGQSDERADAYVVWNKYKDIVEGAEDEEGLKIINKALRQIDGIVENEGEISAAEEARIIRAASAFLGKRARAVEVSGQPLVENPF